MMFVRLRKIAVLVSVLVTACAVMAQNKQPANDWESVPINEWTSDHVRHILERSAWVRLVRGGMAVAVGISPAPDMSPQVDAFSVPTDTLIVLRSSLLVRYALVRKRQLVEKYDSMSPEAKAAFDLKNRAVIDCLPCEKFYVVSITGTAATLRKKDAVMDSSKTIFLSNENGAKRLLANYTPPPASGGEALLFFPRNDDQGQPLITAANERLTLNFEVNRGEVVKGEDEWMRAVQKMEFRVHELVRDGKVIF